MKKLLTLLAIVAFALTLTLGSTGCGKKDEKGGGAASPSPSK